MRRRIPIITTKFEYNIKIKLVVKSQAHDTNLNTCTCMLFNRLYTYTKCLASISHTLVGIIEHLVSLSSLHKGDAWHCFSVYLLNIDPDNIHSLT